MVKTRAVYSTESALNFLKLCSIDNLEWGIRICKTPEGTIQGL